MKKNCDIFRWRNYGDIIIDYFKFDFDIISFKTPKLAKSYNFTSPTSRVRMVEG